MVLRDPPEVKQYAKRGDPPMDQWPGRVVTREDLMKAGGDPRDWFRYGHRLKAYEEAWAEFADARRRRRNFKAGFDWNQILVLGDYGAGKTSVAVHMARHLFGLGHPVFSNASCLFGWHLEHEEVEAREVVGFRPVIPAGDDGALRLVVRAKRLSDMFDAYGRTATVIGVVFDLRRM